MLNFIFKSMSVINGIIFVLSFFTIIKKLGYKNKKDSLFNKVISISLVIIAIVTMSRAILYSSFQDLAISIIILSFIWKFIFKINWKVSILYSSIYSFLYMIIKFTVYYILLFIYIILLEKYKWMMSIRVEFIEFIIFNTFVLLFTQNFNKMRRFYENSKYYIYIFLTIAINAVIIIFLYMVTSDIYNLYSILTSNKIYYNSINLNMPFINFAGSTLPYIVVGINIVFISLLINAIRMAKEESKIKVMNEKLDLQYNYYLTVKESQDRVRKLYHDINNHITNINAVQNNNENVNKYIEDINNEIKDFSSIYDTGNMLLDTILNEKNRICKENNIEFICDINFDKCNFIEMIDITSIFSNLLDNSIEACNKIQNNSIDKYVKIRGTVVKGYYVIRCENSKVNQVLEKNSRILTSKKDKFIHGIGIESIKSSLKKYDGELEINIEENKFIAVIYIPIL